MSELLELAAEPAVAASTASLVATIADNKYFLAHRLAEAGVAAPSLESAVACTAIAQEEAGHARALYSLLETFPRELAPIPLERESDRARKYALSFLRAPNRSFVTAVASLTLADRAFATALDACADSSFAELRKRAVRILGDEPFHQKYANGRVAELADRPDLARELAALLPETLCWFGPAGEEGLERLVQAGIVAKRNEELREEFLDGLAELVAQTELQLPISRVDGRWRYPDLPWTKWDSRERRLVDQTSAMAA